MTDLYPWLVLAHLAGLVVFAIGHGVAIFMAFRVRAERDPHSVRALLEMSRLAISPMYVGLLLLIVGGLGAAWVGDVLTAPWVLASIAVLVVVVVLMYAVATPYYGRLRQALAPDTESPPSAEEFAGMLDSRRPELLIAVGGVGLLVLLWLMVLKPGV